MKKSLTIFILLLAISLVAAQISIDVSIENKEAVSIGEELTYTVRLLQDNTPIEAQVEITISDALEKKSITKTVTSNEENTLLIKSDFPSGFWDIKATYQDQEVEGIFSVAEKSDVEFILQSDKLIIKNNGNTRYTKQVKITIGNNDPNIITTNIKVGGIKELKLIAPEGAYNIKIEEEGGGKVLTRQNVQLFGTGNVVGAIDPNLQGTGFLSAPTDPDKLEEGFFSSSRTTIALVFIGAVFGLGILLFIQKRFEKK